VNLQEPEAKMDPEVQAEAEYMLESPLRCRDCKQPFETVQVVRLLRTKTNFTSTLPRRGYLIVCPSCHAVVSAGLGSRMAIA
jgi:hypothetical protein